MRVGKQIIRWPFVLAFAGPLLLVILRATPLGPDITYAMFGIPALMALWCLAAFVASVIALVALVRRRWRYALTACIVPMAVTAAALQPFTFIHLTNRLGDAVHFVLMRSSYVARIETMPARGQPRFVVFNRGGMVWASNGVVYDESDEVALPRDRQSQAARRRFDRSELGCGNYTVQSLGAHFYAADFSCD
jgi:hypothetical protein